MTTDVSDFAAAWDRTFNAGGSSNVAQFYAADAGVIPAGGSRIEGPAAIEAFFADLKAKGFEDHKIAVASVQRAGDAAIATGTWALRGPGEGGKIASFGGNWVNVLVRNGDGWQIALHTWN